MEKKTKKKQGKKVLQNRNKSENKKSKKEKIALFHPWIKSRGGAEKVVLRIAEALGDVDIYTWSYKKEDSFHEFKNHNVIVIGNKISEKLSRKHFIRGLIPFISKNNIPLKNYDKFIVSTSGVGEFILFKNYLPGNTYVYAHTPLREANKNIIKWNLKNNRYNLFQKTIYKTLVKIYNVFEKRAWKKTDYPIFNSELSKKRAEDKGLLKNKESGIVYPPIEIGEKKKKAQDKKYLLYVSRINSPKRQDVLIKAWNKIRKDFPDYKLVLVGNIDNKKYYEKIKKELNESIKIKENVSSEKLDELYRNCSAGIFLGYEEDFGMVPLEILSYKKPLIAPDIGGYFDLMKNHPLFYKIKEKHDNKEMAEEVSNKLRNFLKNKKEISKSKRKINKINVPDFDKEIRRVLG